MNIFDTLIKDTEIIGISMYTAHEQYALSKLISYSFRIITHNSSVLISSSLMDPDAEDAGKWLNRYALIRHKVRMQIEDLDISDIKVPHIEKVGDAYETLKDQLNNLFADLTPAEHSQEPINPRISEIYESIRSLRDLACSPVL